MFQPKIERIDDTVWVTLPPRELFPIRGAMLLATLSSIPQQDGDQRTLRDFAGFCGRAIEALATIDTHAPGIVKDVPTPGWMTAARPFTATQIDRTRRQHELRLGAARGYGDLIAAAARNNPETRRSRHRKQTLEDSAREVLELETSRLEALAGAGLAAKQRFEQDPNNFEQRTMRASLPVLHLAVALAEMLQIARTAIRGLNSDPVLFPVDVCDAVGTLAAQPSDMLIYTELAMQDFIVHRAEQVRVIMQRDRRLRPGFWVRLREP